MMDLNKIVYKLWFDARRMCRDDRWSHIPGTHYGRMRKYGLRRAKWGNP
jgi:hypothetical protein